MEVVFLGAEQFAFAQVGRIVLSFCKKLKRRCMIALVKRLLSQLEVTNQVLSHHFSFTAFPGMKP